MNNGRKKVKKYLRMPNWDDVKMLFEEQYVSS